MENLHEWMTAIIAEYEELHKEALLAVQMQHSTLRFAAAVFGALLAVVAAVERTSPNLVKDIVFPVSIVSFIIACSVTVIWLGEVLRMARTHIRRWEIENMVEGEFDSEQAPLYYVHFVHMKDPMRCLDVFHYIAVSALFAIWAFGSLFLVYTTSRADNWQVAIYIMIFFLLLLIVYVILAVYKLHIYNKTIEKKIEKKVNPKRVIMKNEETEEEGRGKKKPQ